MKKQIRIGVFGAGRGRQAIDFCLNNDSAIITAVCDNNEDVIKNFKEYCLDKSVDVKIYNDFNQFINEPLDAVVLANYANEHAPYAIECLKRNISVLSEVTPAFTLKECVELCEAVENSKAIYAYGENYCFMEIGLEMKRLCKNNMLGEIEYAEGEYIHNCESIWYRLTYGDKDHWRNKKTAFYYCTHSIGPIIHATKLRPVKVVGFEGKYNEKMKRIGSLSAPFAVEMLTLENGAIVKSTHGQLAKDSIYYSLNGSLGRIESPKNSVKAPIGTIYASLDVSPEILNNTIDTYQVKSEYVGDNQNDIHARADYEMMKQFVLAVSGEGGDYIDVYEAMDMFLPGVFAYRSVLKGGIPQDVPNFRIKEEREIYKNDVSCVLKEIAGDSVIPSNSQLDPKIDENVYLEQKKQFKKYVNKEKGEKNENKK